MGEQVDVNARILQLEGAINLLAAQNRQLQQQNPRVDPFRIPDPIKGLPSFDGNRKQLSQWLATARRTLDLFRDVPDAQQQMYLQAVINKLEGKARDIVCIAGDITTFEEVQNILTHALGDKRDIASYKTALWQNRMTDKVNLHTYYKNAAETVQNIKNLARAKDLYRQHWEAVEAFIEEDALAAFLTGLSRYLFGHCQSAKPRDIREAYAFLCQFETNSEIRSKLPQGQQPHKSNKNNQKNHNVNGESSHQQPARSGNFKMRTEDAPQPMEVDKSLQSRRTFNKKLVTNNLEANTDQEEEEEIPSEGEDFSIEINSLSSAPENFHRGQDRVKKT